MRTYSKKRKVNYLNIKGEKNKGSVVIEMSFIMPVVIVVVFVAINMMITIINKSIALGELQVITYNKERYISDSADSVESDLSDISEKNLTETMSFIENLSIDVDFESAGSSKEILSMSPGYMEAEVNYQEKNIGIFLILNSEDSSEKLNVNEEIRDTAGNLRRWQIYGKVL